MLKSEVLVTIHISSKQIFQKRRFTEYFNRNHTVPIPRKEQWVPKTFHSPTHNINLTSWNTRQFYPELVSMISRTWNWIEGKNRSVRRPGSSATYSLYFHVLEYVTSLYLGFSFPICNIKHWPGKSFSSFQTLKLYDTV